MVCDDGTNVLRRNPSVSCYEYGSKWFKVIKQDPECRKHEIKTAKGLTLWSTRDKCLLYIEITNNLQSHTTYISIKVTP